MQAYLKDLKLILTQGKKQVDRTQVGTISYFGLQTRYDLTKGFPAVTTKRLAWKAMLGELLWMIEGSGDERRLAEITHGTREGTTTIWTANSLAPYWQPKAKFEGDLGRVYGVQWRHWRKPDGTEIDQLQNLVNQIQSDPTSRRHILTAWNPSELDEMALPPCHCFAQFYVYNDQLSCQLYQRSADMFLGTPFNIASYSLLTHMIAQVCGLGVGEFVHTIGDAHIYLDHIPAVQEQLAREPFPLPKLWLNDQIKDITKFTMDDAKLIDYQSHSAIAAKMAV
jgi:thymidylate synthase